MIPSLVVSEIRSALIEYLGTTFALADDDVREALTEFFNDHADGIFRGPYVRVRTPFKSVDPDWRSPLDWLPASFRPYLHQAASFERLSSVEGRSPRPTIVTTGTGSGKTECFLYPALDHCVRMRAQGRPGIKALILYPMNALASDQAGRLADLIATESRLAGLTAGLYVGEQGRHATMGPDHLIDKREVLRADPPDILLTNYKMLDFLLLRREDRDLWAPNEPDTLRYIVLDEFHTYDGAQGTDVAMLLRRLGRTLKMATADRPLGAATPIATSATLGSGPTATDDLRRFAEKVFGVAFEADAVIGETRQSIDEACGKVNYLLPIPDPREVVELGVDDPDVVAAAFCQPIEEEGEELPLPPGDPVALGERLLAHPLTRAVLAAVGDRSRSWTEAIAEVITRAPDWGRAAMREPKTVELAFGRYLWLLSLARRQLGDRLLPLFAIEVQLWVREVSRVLRGVEVEPRFRWRDSAVVERLIDEGEEEDEDGEPPAYELPAVFCRRCGASGWMALESELGSMLYTSPNRIYQAVLSHSPTVRALIRSSPEDPAVRYYDPGSRQIFGEAADGRVAVLVTANEDEAKRSTCPACSEHEGIRFLGLQVASLASVSINTLFGSPSVESEERKLLAFTDSVQDASHRAAFFAGRTHRFNLRSLMYRVIADAERIALADIGDALVTRATTPHERYSLVPPDLLKHKLVRTVWTDLPQPGALELLRDRVAFEAQIEFGLRARVGRTLEMTATAVAAVDIPDLDRFAELVAEDLEAQIEDLPEGVHGRIDPYLRGLLERLRLRGGMVHRFLEPYVRDGGRLWHVWGGRPDGLPPFVPGQGRPTFATTALKGDFDSLTALGHTPTWMVDWGVRCLGLDPADAQTMNRRTFALLANEVDGVVGVDASGGNRVFGLDPRAIRVVPVSDQEDGAPEPSIMRCRLCGHRHAVPPDAVDVWYETPCLRYRCPGAFEIAAPESTNYYRRLYRQGRTRRVVTGEHTGLLRRAAREDLERAFKDGTTPDAPNVITATPTLEMGIDIGDLSAVMLTSVPPSPANYVQRVGRAGRRSGNAVVTTFVRGDTHDLYYLADPEAMIAGDVRPPDCYLDAVETLERQYVAYLIDRVADLTIEAPPIPSRISEVMNQGLDEGSLFRRLIEASTLASEHIDGFLVLFGVHLADETVERLRAFARDEIEWFLKGAVETWLAEYRELGLRRDRLNAAIKKLDDLKHRSAEEDEALSGLRGQRAAIVRLLGNKRREYSLSALERLGVLPNYTLMDDTATLEATMWSKDDDGDYEVETYEYTRAATFAVREFAPANRFYAGGHRHTVDSLEIGTVDQPLYEKWRLCPECGYGGAESAGVSVDQCPRCGGDGIADVGSRYTMLRFRTARASSSEEAARVYDESDDREREHYSVTLTVDVDPGYVTDAWRLADRAFGAEFARRTHLRTINLGFSDRPGEERPIAGTSRHITGFEVCAHCGAAKDARDDRDGSRPERLHQGWCKVRSGATAQRWERLTLYHQLTTEAVRMLLPVSMFEVEERLASFKAALLLGLRHDFGGDPDHLNVVPSELPNRAGQGRYRFLVLYDKVPGGTGYLGRLADPERVREILDGARRIIARCPCRTEGRVACHRCLLGVVDRGEYEVVSRELALELLDDLLDNWDADDSIDTVASVDIGQVEESELERRFKVALQDWAAGTQEVRIRPVPGRAGRDAFEVRINREPDDFLRYRIDEQEPLSTTPSTIPDFVIRRVDQPGREIAVYLDGYQFHASPEMNNLAGDAEKRAAVRASGRLVWNLTWADVTGFHEAVASETNRKPPPRPLLGGRGLEAAKSIHHQRAGGFDFVTVDQNPLGLLVEYLQRPDEAEWRRLALSAVGGGAASAEDGLRPIAADRIADVVRTFATGAEAEWPAADEPVGHGARWTTTRGLRIGAILDARNPNDERWTVFAALPDADADLLEPEHRERWADWHQWANLLQFLGPVDGECTGWIGVASRGSTLAIDDLWVMTLGEARAPGPVARLADVELTPQMKEELELVLDTEVRTLVEQALKKGAPPFAAGFELEGEPLEAAWPEHHVGIVVTGDVRRLDGWEIRPAAGWTQDELLDRLRS